MKGWRTVIFNLVMTAVMIWNLIEPDKPIELDPKLIDTLLATVWGIGNILLRSITDTPVGVKE